VVASAPAGVLPAPPPAIGRRPQGELFAPPVDPAAGPWVERLLASTVFQGQRRLAARLNLPDDRIRQCLLDP
jgi:hypothetical protein